MVGILLVVQLGGMAFANFFSIMDRLMGLRWLFPVGLRPRVRWSLPFFFVIWVGSLVSQIAVVSSLGYIPSLAGEDESSLRSILTITLCNAIFLVLIPVLTGPGFKPGLERLGLSGPHIQYQVVTGLRMAWLISPYIYMINLIANLVFEHRTHAVMKMLDGGLNSATIVLSAVSAVVLAPVVEEMLFRGLLLGALIRKSSVVQARHRAWLVRLSNVACSLFFAILHFSAWPAPFGIFFLSLALGKLYISTGRLWPCVVAHAVFNLTGILGMIAAVLMRQADAVAVILP